VGRIDVARKNLDVILNAWQSLDSKLRTSTEFLVITDSKGADVKKFLSSHDLKLDPSVRFINAVTTEDLIQLVSNARAMVFASQAEGFGLPILEAMQCGCPVVTSNTTCMPEVGGKAALYVSPKNVEEIRHAMERLLHDDELCAHLQRMGLERSKEFSWAQTAQTTIEAYRACPQR
jgi:glycosyltransferase involved in cell wall biosynthesis